MWTGACMIISGFFQTTEPSSALRLCNTGPKRKNISQTKQKQKNKQYFPLAKTKEQAVFPITKHTEITKQLLQNNVFRQTLTATASTADTATCPRHSNPLLQPTSTKVTWCVRSISTPFPASAACFPLAAATLAIRSKRVATKLATCNCVTCMCLHWTHSWKRFPNPPWLTHLARDQPLPFRYKIPCQGK